MRYWWVNQKQTYRHEVPGGYLWSPKRNKNNLPNRAYNLMRTISPGDLVFSYADAHIKAVGITRSYCYEFPKPTEFGKVGDYWEKVGWRVDVNFRELAQPMKPKNHMNGIRPLLPDKYSPLQWNGNGNQTYYLYDISLNMALSLAQLIDRSTVDLVKGDVVLDLTDVDTTPSNITIWEDTIEQSIIKDAGIPDTERETLVKARRGQGQFRTDLLKIEQSCRVTRVDQSEHLVASHTKPWRDCSNEERLDPENGFMLTPTIDHLFDRGFISFENNGDLIISPVAHEESMRKMGLPIDQKYCVGKFTDGQRQYLSWHRDSILL